MIVTSCVHFSSSVARNFFLAYQKRKTLFRRGGALLTAGLQASAEHPLAPVWVLFTRLCNYGGRECVPPDHANVGKLVFANGRQ